jgi:hypothetical protein
VSKTTKKYGKPTFVASERVLWGWKRLDEYAQREFNKNYDNLKDAQKSALHYNINDGKYDTPEVKVEKTATFKKIPAAEAII